jgi:uncharacterized protein (TIGR02001 family)
MAQEVTVTGNVALVTDYAWRNVTQSNQDMTIQGGLDADFGNGFYLGTWASGVDFNDGAEDTNLEVDLYGGYAFEAGGVGIDLGAIYYAYPDAETGDYNFWEVYGALSKEWGAFGLGGSLNWDPDNETIYADVSASYALTDTFSIDGGYGTYLEGFGEYSGWNFGGTLAVMGVDLGVRYYDNDFTGDNDNVIFSVGKAL